MTKLGALLCTGMMVWATPSLAGFEFTPRSAAPSPEQAIPTAALPAPAMDSPMPIIPVEPVSGEVLAAPDTDPVLSNKVSRAEEPVYVRRQKSQPMEAGELLAATSVNAPSSPMTERLVINPYPLSGEAVHGGDTGALGVEQAMLEGSGMLRPVATPGAGSVGMNARANATAKPFRVEAEPQEIASNMTPLPDEQVSRSAIEAVPTMPAPAPVLRAPRAPAASQPAGNFTDAVGFGRDLPLALALSQIVPPEYSYAFDQNVNVGTSVSWEGGKPWNQVLDDMLAPSGMKADIQGGQVVIKNANT